MPGSESSIDELVRKVESLRDPFARASALDLVQAVMDLHTKALDRILEIVSSTCDASTMERIAADDLVSGVLAMHGLHPDDVETRLGRAFERLRRFFDSRGGGITVLEASGEVVRVRYDGTRPGSGAAAKQVIEDAISEAAPEVAQVVIEGVEEARQAGFVPLTDLAGRPRA